MVCGLGGGSATESKPRPKGEVKQGSAYKEETRKIILSLEKIRKASFRAPLNHLIRILIPYDP